MVGSEIIIIIHYNIPIIKYLKLKKIYLKKKIWFQKKNKMITVLDLPEDIMNYYILHGFLFPTGDENIYGELRLICKYFNKIIIRYAATLLNKEYIGSQEASLYLLSINKNITQKEIRKSFLISKKKLEKYNIPFSSNSWGYYGCEVYKKCTVIKVILDIYQNCENFKKAKLERDLQIIGKRKKRLGVCLKEYEVKVMENNLHYVRYINKIEHLVYITAPETARTIKLQQALDEYG